MMTLRTLRDVEVSHRMPFLLSPELAAQMQWHAAQIAAAYRARVAKKTGNLMASASATVEVGGHRNDRWIGKVTVGGKDADYGVLHEFGSPSNPSYESANELSEAVAIWKAGNR